MSDCVLVTGGLGFIGSHVVDGLIEDGYRVAVVDNLMTGKKEYAHPKARYYEIDIRDRQRLTQVFKQEKPQYIIHLAGQSSVAVSIENPVADADINIMGTLNLLELAREWKVRKFVYSSSAAIYGEPVTLPIREDHRIKPLSFYGLSKFVPEEYIRLYHELYGLSYTSFRYANVYGPRQDPFGEGGVISIFIGKLLRGERPVIFGDGEQTRDFVYVKDVARANILALKKTESAVVNLSTRKQTSVNQLVQLLSELTGTEFKPEYAEERPGDIYHSYLDQQEIESYLGWTPQFELREGLRETIRYEQEKQKLINSKQA
ncbi:MAG: GDP-mannose 4,6-dehydratase [Bacillaceae bacterium]|nr:GDP-mannose 4,6-dehydratase [Bacillaceae bacterium]